MKLWDGARRGTIASAFFTLMVPFVFTEPAAAQSFSYGGIVFGTPSCVTTNVLQSEEVTCVARGSNNDLYSIRFNPRTGATLGFQVLGFTTSIAGNPSCVGASFIVCAVRGLENELYGVVFDPVTLTSTGLRRIEQSGPARPFAGDPSCVHTGFVDEVLPNLQRGPRVVCGVRGKDNGLYAVTFSAGAQALGNSSVVRLAPNEVIVGDPSCALANGPIICAARGAGSSLAIIRDFDSGSFQHLYNLSPSGYTVGDPSCASTEISTRFAPALGGDVLTSSPLITCGVRGSDSAFYVIRVGFPPVMQPNGTFDDVFTVVPFSPPGGILSDNAGCASTRLQVVTCGVRGSNGILHLIDFDTASGASTAYEDLNEAIVTAPTCVVFGAASERNVACAVVDLITNGLSSIASVRSPM